MGGNSARSDRRLLVDFTSPTSLWYTGASEHLPEGKTTLMEKVRALIPPVLIIFAALSLPTGLALYLLVVQVNPSVALSFQSIFAVALVFILLLGCSIALGYLFVWRRLALRRAAEVGGALQSLATAMVDAVITLDEDGKIVRLNNAAQTLFEVDLDSVIGSHVSTLIPEQLSVNESFHAALTGDSATADGISELVALRHDEEFPAEVSVSIWGGGGVSRTTVVVRDVSERKAAEEKLRISEQRYRDLIQSAPDAGLVVAEDGSIVLANDQAVGLFGYSQEELLRMKLEDLVPERFRERHVNHRLIYSMSPRVRRMGEGKLLYALRKDDVEFPASISLAPIETTDGRQVFCDVRDISEDLEAKEKIVSLNARLREDNAQLAALNSELEAFSYSVSHDLRAPLRSIDGFSQALNEDFYDVLDDSGKDYLDRIRKAAQRMGLLIDDILALSRITRAEVQKTRVDLATLAGDFLEEIRSGCVDQSANVSIDAEMPVEADPRLMRIALGNLLNNAWKFSGREQERVIQVGTTIEDGETVYFVKDNGVGFDMAYAGRLFSAFNRLHDAREFEGTGIGLATVQRIIHKHGGRIWAKSEPGKGATFYFTLHQPGSDT